MRQAAAMLLNTQIPANARTPFMGTVKTLLDAFAYELEDATYQERASCPVSCWKP